MKKFIILLFAALVLLIAYVSKPDDKKCIIVVVKAIWGDHTPDLSTPQYYEQFMNTTSQAVEMKDWIFFKQVKYKYNDGAKTVAIGAFNKVFTY